MKHLSRSENVFGLKESWFTEDFCREQWTFLYQEKKRKASLRMEEKGEKKMIEDGRESQFHISTESKKPNSSLSLSLSSSSSSSSSSTSSLSLSHSSLDSSSPIKSPLITEEDSQYDSDLPDSVPDHLFSILRKGETVSDIIEETLKRIPSLLDLEDEGEESEGEEEEDRRHITLVGFEKKIELFEEGEREINNRKTRREERERERENRTTSSTTLSLSSSSSSSLSLSSLPPPSSSSSFTSVEDLKAMDPRSRAFTLRKHIQSLRSHGERGTDQQLIASVYGTALDGEESDTSSSDDEDDEMWNRNRRRPIRS